jgi:hypothetical protein
LFLLTFGTTPIHFSIFQIVFEKQTTTGAFAGPRFYACFTAGNWAFENGFTIIAPVFSLERFPAS